MGLFRLLYPIHALVIPSLFLITVPLAITASITTTLAFSILILRVIVVYLDIALSLVPRSFATLNQPSSLQSRVTSSKSLSQPPSPLQSKNRRPRRSSGGSATSLRGLGLMPSVGAERDFEGIGGWRTRDEDDEVWTTVNLVPEKRHHIRSPSGGATTPCDGYLMMKGRTRSPEAAVKKTSSPNSSRARTPTGSRYGFTGMGQVDGYFATMNSSSPKVRK